MFCNFLLLNVIIPSYLRTLYVKHLRNIQTTKLDSHHKDLNALQEDQIISTQVLDFNFSKSISGTFSCNSIDHELSYSPSTA